MAGIRRMAGGRFERNSPEGESHLGGSSERQWIAQAQAGLVAGHG